MNYGIRSIISYNYLQDKKKNQSEDSNQKQKAFSLDIFPQAGIGYGRIENVQDARQAVYIAIDLFDFLVIRTICTKCWRERIVGCIPESGRRRKTEYNQSAFA